MANDIENKVFPKITVAYITAFMIIDWAVQILAISATGNFSSGAAVNQIQSVLLTICMFIPAIILIIFCLFKKISWKDLGLRPFTPLYWLPVFGIILIIQALTFISVLWFSDYPNFIISDGGWKLNNVATIIRQPNKPIAFIINCTLSMMLATIISIPQALGEELAWRGYLQNIFTKRFGLIKGLILLGIIWGLFHLPVNLAGYNHPKSPILGGFIYMVITSISLGIVFGWIRIRTGSVWPVAIAHGSYNIIEHIIVMAKPRINANLYYLYRNGIEILIGLFFLWLIVRNKNMYINSSNVA